MKKFMISLCLILAIAFSAEAQIRRPMPHHRRPPRREMPAPHERMQPNHANLWRNELCFHVIGELGARDLGALFRHDMPYHFSAGGMLEYRFGHFTSIGLGVEYYATYGAKCPALNNMQEAYINTLPIYANLRFSMHDAPIFPFIEGRIGYSAPLSEVTCNDHGGVNHYKSAGLYTGLGVGIKIYNFNLSWGFSVIDLVNNNQGYLGFRQDIITDYYARLSIAF